jgi:hypothetical protein
MTAPNGARNQTRLDELWALQDTLVIECVQLHERMIRAGLYTTGRLMHEVVQTIGYELAGEIQHAREAK